MNDSMYVQYGCGRCAPPDWRNFDASPTLRFERIPGIGKLYTKNEERFPENVQFGDIVKGLPLPDESVRAVYCSHVLEHLSYEECRRALRNTYAILQKGGTFRFVLPDLEFYVRQYVQDTSADAAQKFLQGTQLGIERRRRSLRSFAFDWLRTSAHLWMWDYRAMEQELMAVGFVDIRRATFGDAEDAMFQQVEAENRWQDCLGIQCKKA